MGPIRAFISSLKRFFSDCGWCKDDGLAAEVRCRPRNDPDNRCSSLEDPPGTIEVIQDAAIDPDAQDNIVLIQPQRVKIKLRPGEI